MPCHTKQSVTPMFVQTKFNRWEMNSETNIDNLEQTYSASRQLHGFDDEPVTAMTEVGYYCTSTR